MQFHIPASIVSDAVEALKIRQGWFGVGYRCGVFLVFWDWCYRGRNIVGPQEFSPGCSTCHKAPKGRAYMHKTVW